MGIDVVTLGPDARKQVAAQIGPLTTVKPSKYHAERTEIDGIKFASKKEAERYGELLLLLRGKWISDLKRQVPFELNAPGGQKVGHWVSDFTYFDHRSNCKIVEDVKGFKTQLYLWKKRHFEAQYDMPIWET